MVNNIILSAMAWASTFKSRFSEERGQDFVEYAVLIGAIAIVAAGVLFLASPTINGAFTTFAGKIENCVSFSNSC